MLPILSAQGIRIPRGQALAMALGLLLGALPALGFAAETPDGVVEESTSARYQTTYNVQRHGAFRSPYAGPNSLSAAPERMYTWTTTAHWGLRAWEGGELYFNPELASGVPFSGNLVGLGGFSNGEITRAAGTTPKPYVQRLFLRQTWNQGGGQEVVESDFNQMAGRVDRNRFVLTAGNFSTLDVFDDNAYAKDPRTQFMNWGHWTYAAYDYAADARGYGWGMAGEWYREGWVLRFARMTGPREPNGLPLDFALGKHFGDQLELERGYEWMGREGRVRVLAWRNRAVLARFSDALAYWNSIRDKPSADPLAILQVRRSEQDKYGLGINIQQSLGSQGGLFLRAMKADGQTETHAFTEADDSLSIGAVLQGSAWGRAADAVGLAYSRNGISRQRREYLQSGAISFFIGDGQLSYAPERIVEAYYSLGLFKGSWLTADVQRIINPAYNANRGPLTIWAARLHAEF